MNEDRATRYHRLRRRAVCGRVLAGALVLALLTISGASARLRDLVIAVTSGSDVLAAVLFVLSVVALIEAAAFPFVYYQGVTLEQRYGPSGQLVEHWWSEHVRALALRAGTGLGAGLGVWFLLARTPEWWWLVAAAVSVAALLLLMSAIPMTLTMLGAIAPLQRDALETRLIALAVRAGTRVLGVFEWRVGARTRRANAVLAGLGRSRRILLSDTLLERHSDEEIEVILAHELAHHAHHDLWTTAGLRAVILTVAAWSANLALDRLSGWAGSDGAADLAALPLLALVWGFVWLLLQPLANAVSRAQERRADRYALDMTCNNAAFVSAMKRLSAQNLADERPSTLTEYLFHSHPSVGARIAAAEAWTAGTPQVIGTGERTGRRPGLRV
jgi:STE24 endopeptidase